MLKDRILSTLKFFDLQDYPLTLLELHRFLLADRQVLQRVLDIRFEVLPGAGEPSQKTDIVSVLASLESECAGEAECRYGFYYLKGREEIVGLRLKNHLYGLARERRVSKWAGFLRYIPFVRGAALGGSQTLGQQKPTSDIDLFIVTDPRYLWLARTLVTVYFQVIGLRRHGKLIANRFCLNHYVSGPKALGELRNLYSGMEYARHRAIIYPQGMYAFHQNNLWWMRLMFPNLYFVDESIERQAGAQKFLEKLLAGRLGDRLETWLKNWRLPKIKKQQFIIVEDDELSFHPHSKQQALLQGFFEFQK
jgi:hypothetical protein